MHGMHHMCVWEGQSIETCSVGVVFCQKACDYCHHNYTQNTSLNKNALLPCLAPVLLLACQLPLQIAFIVYLANPCFSHTSLASQKNISQTSKPHSIVTNTHDVKHNTIESRTCAYPRSSHTHLPWSQQHVVEQPQQIGRPQMQGVSGEPQSLLQSGRTPSAVCGCAMWIRPFLHYNKANKQNHNI